MSTTKKTAAAEPSLRPRHRFQAFLAGAGLALAFAWLAGRLLSGELQALRASFIPLSSLAGGVVASTAACLFTPARERARGRWMRVSLGGLGVGVALCLGLYLAFTTRIVYGDSGRSVAFVTGWARSPLCRCSPSDALCLEQMGLEPSRFEECWQGHGAVRLGLALSFFLTLAGGAMAAGLLILPENPSPEPPSSPQALAGPPGYLDFDVWLDEKTEGVYRAKAWSGAAGFEATETFSLPPFLMEGAVDKPEAGPLRGGAVSAAGAEGVSAEQVGHELFQALFQGELLKAFQGCVEKARSGPGVRIRLRLNDVPHLAGLPWEYLCDTEGKGFLALSGRTPVVRYLELSEALGTLLVEPPLRILAVLSAPRGYRELGETDEEWRRLLRALEPLGKSGLIEVERLERPTFGALEARLSAGPPVHVLHFIGHGGFSELRGEGVLVFEDEEGQGAPVGAASLAVLLQQHPSLRLAVLNACNGARASSDDTFTGTAQALVQQGIPAVIAMLAEVMDETACSFAEKFYRGLADGLPVDACVSAARRSLAAEQNPEWGTPVLYLRATDGRLFAFGQEGPTP